MKILHFSFVLILFATITFAVSSQNKSTAISKKQSSSFSTTKDFSATLSGSNLKIKNTGTSAATIYGLYIRQFSYVPVGQSCTSAVSIYSSSANVSAGSMVMPVTIEPNVEAVIGANYLYNMIYNALYYIQITIPSSPPGCALPGCTWGADTTQYQWCIYLGAMAPVSVTGAYTSKVVPSTTSMSGGGFNYNLISTYEEIGPISCDDQALTCSLSTAQTQTF